MRVLDDSFRYCLEHERSFDVGGPVAWVWLVFGIDTLDTLLCCIV